MAEFYGACTGNAGGKYNVWLSVVQNYQNIENNFSNISVGLYLKRNDGESDSAYNLNDWENSASIAINGETKVWRNLDIDTRGNVTVTLAEWTGDVFHNTDGSLSLNIEGDFVMGNKNVTGGQAFAGFNCTVIPRKSYMTFGESEVYPGGNITCNVVSASSEFSHSINFYLEQTEGSIWLAEGVSSGIFTVPTEWASQLPWSVSANISVVLTTYYYGQYVGSDTYSIKLVIPDTNDFKPTFDLVVERIDNGVPGDWNVCLKGISGVKVDVANLNLKYGAVVMACEARVGNVTYNGVPSWFYLVDSGNVEISVYIRDSRGLTYTASTTVFVIDYFPPSLTVNSIKRCNANGELTQSGEYFLLDYNVNLCSVDGKNEMLASYRLGTSSENLGEEIFMNNSPVIIGDGTVVPSKSYVLRFCIYDSVNWWGITSDRSIPSADIPFNIRKGGKGAAFGCYAEKDNELTIGWDFNLKGKLVSEKEKISVGENISYVTENSETMNYPCLEICCLNIGFVTAVDIPENTVFVVGSIQPQPKEYSPLNVFVWGMDGGSVYVDPYTKEILFRCSAFVPSGSGIYINGIFATKQEE